MWPTGLMSCAGWNNTVNYVATRMILSLSLLHTDMESDSYSVAISDDQGQGNCGHYLCNPGRLVYVCFLVLDQG